MGQGYQFASFRPGAPAEKPLERADISVSGVREFMRDVGKESCLDPVHLGQSFGSFALRSIGAGVCQRRPNLPG